MMAMFFEIYCKALPLPVALKPAYTYTKLYKLHFFPAGLSILPFND